ncbi:protein of unknown function [Melghirimyces thermohalophilus]|uniref:Lipoprotein n=2 Tax=Melghirimyces thermohalophilus TaxID=1236220 RepID=A0A1G6RZD7_9BACL|nr:protein of unknown function [Melghirimyces thermohalophilus]
MMNANKWLLFLLLIGALLISGCSSEESQQDRDQQPNPKTPDVGLHFTLDRPTVEGLKKGEIRGVSVQLGDTEKKVHQKLGEPQEQKDQRGSLELKYEGGRLQFIKMKDTSQLNSMVFPISKKRNEIIQLLGRPEQERTLNKQPEMSFAVGPYQLLFLTDKKSKEGPYNEVLIIKE